MSGYDFKSSHSCVLRLNRLYEKLFSQCFFCQGIVLVDQCNIQVLLIYCSLVQKSCVSQLGVTCYRIDSK